MPNQDKTVLVQLYLRGGADALTICAPTDEPNYDAARDVTRVHVPGAPGIPAARQGTAIAPAVIDAGGNLLRTGWMIPDAMTPLLPLYQAGKLVFVHGAGSVIDTRSHFVQQANTEYAEDGTLAMSPMGWLGRYLATVPARYIASGKTSGLRALALNNTLITSFNGGSEVTPTLTPDSFAFPGGTAVQTNLESIYASTTNALQETIASDASAVLDLSGVQWQSHPSYPDTDLGRQFGLAFDAIQSLDDLELVAIDYDNIGGRRWDTHDNQGCFNLPSGTGDMHLLMDNLASTLQAFMTDVATLTARKVVVFVYSEFGRTLLENVSEGTDHGRGGIAMILGDHVTTGGVFTHPTNWTSLGGASNEEDQPVTVDLRVLQADIMTKCMGVSMGVLPSIIPDAGNLYPDQAVGDYGILS